MKLAVTCVYNEVFGHFGHCPSFLVCEIENGEIVSQEMLETNGAGCSSIAELLSSHNVDALICGGIGGGAINHLASFGIKVYPGASGNALEQVKNFISGELNYDPDAKCASHDHDHECHNEHKCH